MTKLKNTEEGFLFEERKQHDDPTDGICQSPLGDGGIVFYQEIYSRLVVASQRAILYVLSTTLVCSVDYVRGFSREQ